MWNISGPSRHFSSFRSLTILTRKDHSKAHLEPLAKLTPLQEGLFGALAVETRSSFIALGLGTFSWHGTLLSVLCVYPCISA